MLSPRYLSYNSGTEFRLVDVYQARNFHEKPFLLSPVWRSSALNGAAVWSSSSIRMRRTLTGESYLRVSFRHTRRKIYVMELPALHDIRDHDRDVLYVPIPDIKSRLIDTYRTYSSFNHGLLFQHQLRDVLERSFTGYCFSPFSLAHCPESARAAVGGVPVVPPGMIRLERPTTSALPEVLLGNVQRPQKLPESDRKWLRLDFDCGISLDDISGRFVQLVWSEEGDQREIVLYTFDSVPTI